MTSEVQFVTRLVQRSEIPRVATILNAAFNDPTNTTPDEISVILHAEEDAEQKRPLTREESIAKETEREYKTFDKGTYTYVGVYAVSNSHQLEEGQGKDLPSTTLPNGSELVGFATWTLVTPETPSGLPELQSQVDKSPNLLNKFFLQMQQTRESTMHNKTYWFLKLLAIHPKFQRKGLGTLLVNWGVQRANSQQIDAWLESSPMGKGAYLKAGFKVLGTDTVQEPRAKKGYVEWPYMIHQYKPTP